jgi:hypothetical protein
VSISNRLDRTEAKACTGGTHIIWCEGQTKEEAIKIYGKPIKSSDAVHFISWKASHSVEAEELAQAKG